MTYSLVPRVRKQYPNGVEERSLLEAAEGLILDIVCYDIVAQLQAIADHEEVPGLLPAGTLYDEFFCSLASLEDAIAKAKGHKKKKITIIQAGKA